jgi:DNA polymerase-3 subunit epsilon
MGLFGFLKTFFPSDSSGKARPQASENSAVEPNKLPDPLVGKPVAKSVEPVVDDFPAKNIYSLPSKNKKNVYIKELTPTYIDTPFDGIKISLKATLMVSGSAPVSEEEVNRCGKAVAPFFLEIKPPAVKTYPSEPVTFINVCITNDQDLNKLLTKSPLGLQPLIKALRAKIRTLKKEKKQVSEELRALKNIVYMFDLASELELKGIYLDSTFSIVKAPQILAANDFHIFDFFSGEFKQIGYELFPSFSKTDTKWLIEEFGAPDLHASPSGLVFQTKSRLIQNYYKTLLVEKKKYEPSLTLNELVTEEYSMFMRYHKSWYQRVKGKPVIKKLGDQYLDEVIKRLNGNFVVADLETTGLSCEVDEIIEIGAVLCNSSGEIVSKFEVLISPRLEISEEIQSLTGITNELLLSDGIAIDVGLAQFKNFIGNCPLFFHNSDFDSGFLRCASDDTDIQIDNSIYDTLTIAKLSWKGRSSYSLANLCSFLNIQPSTHRALRDAEAALQVLLAAKRQNYSSQ